MHVKVKMSGGMKRLAAGSCLSLGRRISNVECGLAYAAQAVQAGNAVGLVAGLEVASRFSKEVEDLLPRAAGGARAIKIAAKSIDRDLRKKKKVSGEESGKVLSRIRALAKRVGELHEEARKQCGGQK